ncbi:hypothetical protein N9M83_05150 [Candidatus Poseidonia alphae]|uniref:hypothetical protein n=1 Tax=Candidatus Poseidonia alphae TaxID=1915863 RepID=UPI002315C670|nr:hypothetical protein [Candidatus Poseidonia alphae]MDA8639275.1 hypothetical protein [Candidatus Poseidonia alphae]MDA8759602.1 hypothetical protein [Candidatus Poseidonia alphae]MDA8838932.1 hypothetical protein [Candidatus Poseidonia alphae]MDA9168041.1 hypothetical protein [Candidatus Poseidonia alphae]
MSARRPKDEEEFVKALLAIEEGRGKSIAEVIEEISGSAPSGETIEAVRNRLQLAQENGESVDIAAIVESLNSLMSKWV